MQVSNEVFQWLTTTTGAIPPTEGKNGEDNTWVLSKLATSQIESGVAFVKMLRTISKLQNTSKKSEVVAFPELDGLKEMNTPAARVNNWNVLCEALKKIQIVQQPEAKGLLIGAEQGQLMSLISDLMMVTNDIEVQKQQKSRMLDYKEETDVTKLDINKDPTRCKSCIELLLVLLSKHLSLPPTQTASLFTHNSKYLAHLLAKGVKGLFEPVITFFQEMYANVPTLLSLFKDDASKKNLHFTLNSLKPGFVSKSVEVAQWTARLLSKLAFEFGDNQLLAAGWEWFVGENGGLVTALLGLKRHPDLRDLVVQVLLQFARYNFIELFTQHLKRAQPEPKDLINIYIALLKPLTQSNSSSDEIFNSGILDDWIDFAIDSATDDDKNSTDARIAALAFLTDVWIQFPDKVEEIEDRANAIISLFNKACREKQSPLVITCLTLLFQLLIHFGQQKNQYAPNVYRTLTLSIIENCSKIAIREFIMINFMTIYEILESIPLNILIEPLVRQIQVTEGSTFSFNIFDFNFFTYISRNERLQLKNAIQLLDLFFKIYLNNPVFSGLASVPILNIVNRFIESDTLHEFVIKFVKVALAMFYASEKKKRPKEKILPLYNGKSTGPNQNISQNEIETEIVQAQKRALIVEMIKSIAGINSQELNDKIKPLVAHTNIQIKQFTKQNSKGMIAILLLFGNADEILQQYEKEYLEHQEALKLEEDQKELEVSPRDKGDVLKGMEENLKKFSRMTKEEITHLAYLRNPKADKKVLLSLEHLKQNYDNQEEKKKQEQQKIEDDQIREKEVLKKQLAKRSQEQGISNMNQKDKECSVLFSFGTREKQLKRETASGVPPISYIDLDTEEKRDREMIGILLRKYSKALKNIFVKYSNSGFSAQFSYKNSNSFDSIKEKSSLISVPEIYRFIKDYEFVEYLSKDEHSTLVKLIAVEQQRKKKKAAEQQQQQQQPSTELVKVVPLLLRKKSIEPWQTQPQEQPQPAPAPQQNMFEKNQQARLFPPGEIRETKAFDFQGFLDYIVQFAGYIFSKPPEDLRHLPLSASLQKVFDHLKEVTRLKGQSTLLFEDPENLYFGEADVIRSYNKKLEENPDFVLPQGYKKVKEREMKFDYSLDPKNQIPMKESFKKAYDILNDLFKEKLNFYLVEPKSVSKEVLRAVPLIGVQAEVESHYLDHFKTPQLTDRKGKKEKEGLTVSQSMDVLAPWGKPDSTKTLPSTFNYKPKYGEKRVLEIEQNRKLDLGMKLALSTFSYKDRTVAEQVAFCLDDIIKAVEQGKDSAARKKIENLIIKERKKEEEEEEARKKKQKEISKKGHDFVISRAKEILIQNEGKEKEKKEKEQKEKEKKEKTDKKKTEELDAFWKEKKETLEQSKKKEIEDKKKEEEQKKQGKKENKEKKEKEFNEFIKKQIDKQSEEFKKIKEKEKKEEEEKKKKVEAQINLIKKAHDVNVKTNAERVEFEKQVRSKIKGLLESSEITGVIKQNDFKLHHLFECLKKYTFREISSNVIRDDEIDQKTFNWFCHRFSILPEILSTAEVALVYRSVSRGKELEDLKPIGINLEDFKEAMLRIAIKGKNIFNKFAESAAKGALNQSAMQQIADEENKKEDEIKKKDQGQKNKSPDKDDKKSQKNIESIKYVVDDYGDIDATNAKTLEMLFHYLGLPNDKIGINEAIKHARESLPKPNLFLKQELMQKIEKDPKELVRYNRPQLRGKGKNGTILGESQGVNNSTGNLANNNSQISLKDQVIKKVKEEVQ